MRLRLDRPAVVCTAAVSLFTAVAAVAPSPARADDTLPTRLPSVASLAEAATTTATDAVAAAPMPDTTLDAGAAAAPDAAPVAEAPESPPSEEPAAAALSGDTATQVPASMPDAATEPAVAADITPAKADTATDTPPAAAQPTPPTPSTSPTAAPTPAPASANINVSVRIDSPGDNGPVSQVNVAGGSVTPLSTAATPEKTSSPGGATQSSAPPPASQWSGESPDTWYWSWDCLGAAPISAISPGGSGSGSLPASWTWIWNCGGNSSQYQTGSPSQYSQINTNIAVRISSPGNDGPVTQVNVDAGISIPLPVPVHSAPFPSFPVSVPPPLETALGDASGAPGPALVASTPVDTTDITAALDLGAASDTSAEPVSATPFAAPARVATMQTAPRLGLASRFQRFRIPLARIARFAPASRSAVAAAWRASSPASSNSPKAPARPPEATPRPRAPHAPSRAPVISVSGVSASAAAGGGGSSGSGLPLLLALPFVAALLDLARRVALEHAALPPGHRRRAPDRPG